MSQSAHTPKDRRKSTEPERSAEEIRRMERLENMGLLATRVAHDLNNMLAPMRMALPIIRSAVSDPAARSLLDSVETTAGRATALVRQILEYAGGSSGQLQLVPINQLLNEVVSFARETFPRNIRIEEKIPDELWKVNANLSQLYQVLLNLCVNARDAMPGGGVLGLHAENCVLDHASAAKIEHGRAGSFLVLQVNDTGTGFSPTIIAKLWQPFTTTKKTGKGSGLGLSMVRDIIVRHHGFIELSTQCDKGSSFRIYLPAAEKSMLKASAVVAVETKKESVITSSSLHPH